MRFYSFCLFFLIIVTSPMATAQKLDSLQAVLDTARGEYKVKTFNEFFRAYLPSDPTKALGYARQALNLSIEIRDKKGTAAAYNNLGVAYRNYGALDKSLEYYLQALRLYEELENKEGIATLKNNIANIYSIKREYGQAMNFLEESYQLFVELNDKEKIIGSMNNLGNLNLDLQLYEKAMRYYSQAYQLSSQIGKHFADPVTNVGNLHFRQGNYQKAIENYEIALNLEKANNNRHGILNALVNIGIAYTKAGQPGPAQQYLNEAEILCRELEAYSFLPPILKHNSEIMYRQGKMKDAYETFVRYDSLREKIYGEESTRKITQMEMAFDMQEMEREIEVLHKEDEIKSLQLRNSRLFIVLVILTILIVIGGVNLYFMGNRKKLFGASRL